MVNKEADCQHRICIIACDVLIFEHTFQHGLWGTVNHQITATLHMPIVVGKWQMISTTSIMLFTILTLLTVNTTAQETSVLRGIATDGHRNGIIGVNVVIKGTTIGTVTDTCGRFSIPIDEDEFTLLFHGMSYDDIRTYEIRLNKSEITTAPLVFQLGHLTVDNTGCEKVDRKLERRVID